MKETSAKAKYDIEYAKNKIKRVPLDMQKSDYEKLQAAANAAGEKINAYIKKEIAERMEREQAQAGGSVGFPAENPEKN